MNAKKRKRDDDTKSNNATQKRFKHRLNSDVTSSDKEEKKEINAILTKVSIDSTNSDPSTMLMNCENPDVFTVIDNPNASESKANEALYVVHQEVSNNLSDLIVDERRDDIIETNEIKRINHKNFISNNSIDSSCIPKQINLTKPSIPREISQNDIKDLTTYNHQRKNEIFEKRIEQFDLDSQASLDEDCHSKHVHSSKGFMRLNSKYLSLCLIFLSILLMHFAILIYDQLCFIYELKISNEDLQQTVNWLNTQIQIQEEASVAALNQVALMSNTYKAQQFFEYTSHFEKRLQFQIAESIDAVNMVASIANQRKDQLIKEERDLIIMEAINAINTVSMSASQLSPLQKTTDG